MIHSSSLPPSTYAQWEVSQDDGTKLIISGPSARGIIRYGFWDDRSQDVVHSNVSFPFTIDPIQDGIRDVERSRGLGDVYKRQDEE